MKPAKPGGRVEARMRRKRGNLVAAVAIALAAGALAAVVTAFLVLSQNLSAAHRDVDLLTQQVKSLGGTPVAGPKGDPGAAGIIGSPGPSGPSGPSGAPGKAGKAAPTITPKPGPTGPPGASGSPGVPGNDSTIPGPTGPPGQNGASGAPGKDGTDGKDGADGKDASPAAEQTFTDQYGNVYQCRLVDGSDPDNPRYSCEQTSTASPEPSPTPSAASDSSSEKEPSPGATTSPGLLPLLRRRL